MIIGEIYQVKGVKVSARLFKKLPPYIVKGKSVTQGPRIHSFIKTYVGLDKVICKIVGEIQNLDKKDERILELVVIGNFTKEQFYPGIKVLPLISAKIELISPNEFELLYHTPKYPIFLGYDLFDSTLKVNLDMNKIAASHIGVFGNTGSGKSNTLTRILREYISLQNKNKVAKNKSELVIFDLNDEYGSNAIIGETYKNIYNLTTKKDSEKKYPIDFMKLTEDQIGVLLSATKKTQMPVVKAALRNLKDIYSKEKKIDAIKWAIVNGQRQIITSIKQELRDVVVGLDNFLFIGGKANNYIDESKTYFDGDNKRYHFINNIEDESLQKINLIDPTTYLERLKLELIYAIVDYLKTGNNFEFVRPLIGRMNSRISDFNKVFVDTSENEIESYLTVIQLGNVNREMKEVIPSIISSVIYETAKENDRFYGFDKIRILVIDEAHNVLYQPKESDDVASNNIEAFETIIKEGRKHGVFLWLSSQRPSDISPTITSQIHHYFIHKLVNNSDIQAIRKSVPYIEDEMISMISALGVGECLVSGQALTTATFVRIEEVNDINKPLSSNIVLFGEKGIFGD